MTPYRMLIDGEWVAAASGRTLEVVDPATGQAMATVPDAQAEDVDRAVRAARRAFEEGWRDVTAQERGRILFRLAERVRARTKELAELETLNSGKPLAESEFDIADVATCLEYYGGLATKLHGEVLNVPDNAISLALREPLGVAGQIIPWNYPLMMAAWKLGPALCAGCTTVIKPAEQTPLTLLALAKDFEDCGLPKGVVNVITGFGESAGAPLVAHAEVDKIAFTGSAEVGKIIMRSAAETLKKVSLELGGKSPNIFFADADFESAVDGALFGVFINQGEVCSAGSRVLVQRPIYQKMLDAMVAKAKTIKLGPGMDPVVEDGPRRLQGADGARAPVPADRQGRGEGRSGRRAAAGGRAAGRLLRRAHDLLRRRQLGEDRARGDLRAGDVRHPLRRRSGRAAHRERHALRPGGRGVEPRHLQVPAHGEEAPGGHRVGEPHAADVRGGALGRLQDERHRARAGALGRRGVPAGQAGATST